MAKDNTTLLPSTSVLRRRGKKNDKAHSSSKEVIEDPKKGWGHDPRGSFRPLGRIDFYILAILTSLAFFTRFFRLGVPSAVVFDDDSLMSFIF